MLNQFEFFKSVNSCLIFIYPVILLVSVFCFNKVFIAQTNKGWALFAYIFGVAEHINYYHVQLMYDNKSDWKYLSVYKKLKTASLRKDFKENKI